MEINRHSPLPLYFQLKEILLKGIHRGDWKPGEKLPTEDELQQEYDISRTTIRQALRELELEGWINRRAGRGTFVTFPKIQEGTEAFHLGSSASAQRRQQLSWKVLSAEWEAVPENTASALGLSSGEQALCLRRLRLAESTPIGHVVSCVPAAFAEHLDLPSAQHGGSMNYIKGINLDRCTAERVVEALPAQRNEMEILGIERGSPVLVITRLLKDPNGHPVEYFRGVYRGDLFQYHIQTLPAQV